MKLEKFELREAERAGVPVEHLREYYEITRCECGNRRCRGWQMRYRFGTERRRLVNPQ